MWSSLEEAEFHDRGYVRLGAAFSVEQASRMVDVAWRELESNYGMSRSDRETWATLQPRTWKTTKSSRLFDPIGGPALREAIDGLLGSGTWDVPHEWGQVLVTFPQATEWTLPYTLWHVDFGYDDPVEPLTAVKIFAFFGSVPVHGGGTLIITRSHHLVQRFVASLDPEVLQDHRRTRSKFMSHDPWLRRLANPSDQDPDRTRHFMDDETDVTGIRAQVVELTGKPGDIVIAHPWLVHCVAPNTAQDPRFMRTKTVSHRARVMSDNME